MLIADRAFGVLLFQANRLLDRARPLAPIERSIVAICNDPFASNSGHPVHKNVLIVQMGQTPYLGLGRQSVSMSREAVPNLNQSSRIGTDRDRALCRSKTLP